MKVFDNLDKISANRKEEERIVAQIRAAAEKQTELETARLREETAALKNELFESFTQKHKYWFSETEGLYLIHPRKDRSWGTTYGAKVRVIRDDEFGYKTGKSSKGYVTEYVDIFSKRKYYELYLSSRKQSETPYSDGHEIVFSPSSITVKELDRRSNLISALHAWQIDSFQECGSEKEVLFALDKVLSGLPKYNVNEINAKEFAKNSSKQR